MTDCKEIAELWRRFILFGFQPNSFDAEFSCLYLAHTFQFHERRKFDFTCALPEFPTNISIEKFDSTFRKYQSEITRWDQVTKFQRAQELLQEAIDFINKNIDEKLVLDMLLMSARMKHSCREHIVLCLAILTKQTDKKDLVAAAYSALPEVCNASELFLLFLQFCKILSHEKKTSGWGRGLRKAVHKWYLRWDPYKLALEVTRCPKAYDWTHRDVIKLAHIKLHDFPEGSQTVLSYIHGGFIAVSNKRKEKTPDLINFLEAIQVEGHTNSKAIIKKAEFLKDKYSYLSLKDFPFCCQDPEVWLYFVKNSSPVLLIKAMLNTSLLSVAYSNSELNDLIVSSLAEVSFTDELIDPVDLVVAYNVCRKKGYDMKARVEGAPLSHSWQKFKCPSSDKFTKAKTSNAVPEMAPIADSLANAIERCTQKSDKSSKSAAVCIDMHKEMGKYVPVTSSSPPEEISVIQAATLILTSLASSDYEKVTPYLAGKDDAYVPNPCRIHFLKSKMKSSTFTPMDVEACLTRSLLLKKETCVFIFHSMDASIVDSVRTTMKELLPESSSMRVVLLGSADVRSKSLPSEPDNSNIAVLWNFSRNTIPFIKAFHDRVI